MEKKTTERDMEYLDKWTRRSEITHGISDERLIEICNAERDGRCVVLPCKIGEIVYEIHRCIDGADRVRKMEFWWSDIPKFGKTVFLTREAAESAMKGEQDGQ